MKKATGIILLMFFSVTVALAQADPNDFILLNIEMLNRAEIGRKLQEVNQANPKLVAFNVTFGSDRGSTDDPLEQAFKEIETDILGYNLKDRRLGSHAKFMQHAADSGMTRLVADVRLWPLYFIPYQTKFGKLQDHLSISIASYLVEELPDYAHEGIRAIEYFPLLDYTILNLSEFDLEKHGDLIEDNVVLVGFLGPGDEDKQFTPLGKAKGVPEGVKDTYGLEIVAYMVRTILNDASKE